MFHILVLLHPSLTLIQNLNNSLDYICHLVFPFSHPILFLNRFVLHNNQVCQKISSTGCYVVAGGFGPGGIGNFSAVTAVCLMFECTECSVEDTVDFAYHHPSPLLSFYKWCSLVPLHTSLSALGSWLHRGLLLHEAVTQLLLWGGCRCGKNWPVFS